MCRLALQSTLTFNASEYACGQEYQFFAWASNAYGQSAGYEAASEPFTMPACPPCAAQNAACAVAADCCAPLGCANTTLSGLACATLPGPPGAVAANNVGGNVLLIVWTPDDRGGEYTGEPAAAAAASAAAQPPGAAGRVARRRSARSRACCGSGSMCWGDFGPACRPAPPACW